MTKIQLAHHVEQMEAMRVEFLALWLTTLEPRALAMMSGRVAEARRERVLAFGMDLAWQAFKAGKQQTQN